MKYHKIIIFSALLTFLLLPTSIFACNCTCVSFDEFFPLKVLVNNEKNKYDAVFIGTAVGYTSYKINEGIGMHFNVEKNWKGVKTSEVIVVTSSAAAICGVHFEIGKSYLIYASSKGERLFTSGCSRTTPNIEIDAEIKALGKVERTFATKTPKQKESVFLDKSKPTVHINFERLGKEQPIYAGDSEERIYLTLTNNSKWSIYLDVFVYGDSEKRGIHHTVERENKLIRDTKVPSRYKLEHVRFPFSELKSRKSIRFSVPQNHLTENLKIRINFLYKWETENLLSDSYSHPQHSVFFSSSDLQRILNKIDSKK